MNDPIGNPMEITIKIPRNDPASIEYEKDRQTIRGDLDFVTAGGVQWHTNQVPATIDGKDSSTY